MTQKDAAAIMGITQQASAKMYVEAAEKIAAVYRKWEYGEVCVEYTLDDEDTEEEAVECVA
ncbi:hypothetical protein D3C73_1543940 [compost metagenome]